MCRGSKSSRIVYWKSSASYWPWFKAVSIDMMLSVTVWALSSSTTKTNWAVTSSNQWHIYALSTNDLKIKKLACQVLCSSRTLSLARISFIEQFCTFLYMCTHTITMLCLLKSWKFVYKSVNYSQGGAGRVPSIWRILSKCPLFRLKRPHEYNILWLNEGDNIIISI